METAVEIPAAAPETEVLAKAQRRRFTAEYKRRVLKAADRALYEAKNRGRNRVVIA